MFFAVWVVGKWDFLIVENDVNFRDARFEMYVSCHLFYLIKLKYC